MIGIGRVLGFVVLQLHYPGNPFGGKVELLCQHPDDIFVRRDIVPMVRLLEQFQVQLVDFGLLRMSDPPQCHHGVLKGFKLCIQSNRWTIGKIFFGQNFGVGPELGTVQWVGPFPIPFPRLQTRLDEWLRRRRHRHRRFVRRRAFHGSRWVGAGALVAGSSSTSTSTCIPNAQGWTMQHHHPAAGDAA